MLFPKRPNLPEQHSKNFVTALKIEDFYFQLKEDKNIEVLPQEEKDKVYYLLDMAITYKT